MKIKAKKAKLKAADIAHAVCDMFKESPTPVQVAEAAEALSYALGMCAARMAFCGLSKEAHQKVVELVGQRYQEGCDVEVAALSALVKALENPIKMASA